MKLYYQIIKKLGCRIVVPSLEGISVPQGNKFTLRLCWFFLQGFRETIISIGWKSLQKTWNSLTLLECEGSNFRIKED